MVSCHKWVAHNGTAWEDSPELLANITWSRSLPTRFQELFNYDIKPFLPLCTFQQNALGVQTTEPGPFHCILDTEDQGTKYVNDFHKALEAGYQEYVETLTEWLHKFGIQLSVQPAYGLPMDMQAAIPFMDVPECESLTFLDLIDSYRQFVGPANLAERNIISNELGAVRSSGFRYHLPELLFSANRGFASGVNQYILHGQAYSGNYYQTTWPGHVPFNYLFSEPWSPREPVWEHGFEETLNYLARVQYVQQSGVPKVDVAIYNKESTTTIRTVYSSSDLIERGEACHIYMPERLLIVIRMVLQLLGLGKSGLAKRDRGKWCPRSGGSCVEDLCHSKHFQCHLRHHCLTPKFR